MGPGPPLVEPDEPGRPVGYRSCGAGAWRHGIGERWPCGGEGVAQPRVRGGWTAEAVRWQGRQAKAMAPVVHAGLEVVGLGRIAGGAALGMEDMGAERQQERGDVAHQLSMALMASCMSSTWKSSCSSLVARDQSSRKTQ